MHNRPRSDKVVLFVIFGAGIFATVAAVIRLHTIYNYTEATDPFRNSLRLNLWSMIEVCVAICCASVSALKPVVDAFRYFPFGPRDGGGSDSNGDDGGVNGKKSWDSLWSLWMPTKGPSEEERNKYPELVTMGTVTEDGVKHVRVQVQVEVRDEEEEEEEEEEEAWLQFPPPGLTSPSPLQLGVMPPGSSVTLESSTSSNCPDGGVGDDDVLLTGLSPRARRPTGDGEKQGRPTGDSEKQDAETTCWPLGQ